MKKVKQIVQKMGLGLLVVSFFAVGASFLQPSQPAYALDCSVLPKSICDTAEKKPAAGQLKQSGVYELLKYVLKFLTAGIGIVAVGAVVYAGILYSSAGDNQQQVQESKTMIKNVAIGILAFAGMFLILNWLVPGGVFG